MYKIKTAFKILYNTTWTDKLEKVKETNKQIKDFEGLIAGKISTLG